MKHRKLLWLILVGLVLLVNINSQARTCQPKSRKREPRKIKTRKKAKYKMTDKVEVKLSYDISVPGKTQKIRFLVLLPKTIRNRQRIHKISYSPEPAKLFSKDGNNYAEFIFIEPQKQLKIEINIQAILFRYDLSIARKKPQDSIPKDPNASNFLTHEKYIEKDNPQIQKIAKSIKGSTKTNLVKNIYDCVIKRLKYYNDNKSTGALDALQKKKGQCIEYADLFVAICRAKKIPARVVMGYITDSRLSSRHAWTEVYLGGYGWVPFDPTWGDVINKSAREFHHMKSVYIYLSHIRNNNVLQNYYRWWYWGDKIEVEDSIEFK